MNTKTGLSWLLVIGLSALATMSSPLPNAEDLESILTTIHRGWKSFRTVLQCYSCEGRGHDKCATDPANYADKIECPHGSCSLEITAEKNNGSSSSDNLVWTVKRGCSQTLTDEPTPAIRLNGDKSITHCFKTLCNSAARASTPIPAKLDTFSAFFKYWTMREFSPRVSHEARVASVDRQLNDIDSPAAGAALQRCYSCDGRDSELCLTNPSRSANQVDCPSGVCSIVRTTTFGKSGTRKWVSRGCGHADEESYAKNLTGNTMLVVDNCDAADLCNSYTGAMSNPYTSFPVFSADLTWWTAFRLMTSPSASEVLDYYVLRAFNGLHSAVVPEFLYNSGN